MNIKHNTITHYNSLVIKKEIINFFFFLEMYRSLGSKYSKNRRNIYFLRH